MVDKSQLLFSAAQVRELDKVAIQTYGIPGFELMSRAGLAAFEYMLAEYPETESITVFCGAGNNAGDGYVVAALALQKGLKVTVFSLVDSIKLKGDALTAYEQFIRAGGQISSYRYYVEVDSDVIVDALLGTGLDRDVTGIFADAIENINASSKPVIALDIPSGLNANTGNAMGLVVNARLTVTFIALKKGLFTGMAGNFTGKLVLADLSVPDKVYSHVKHDAILTKPPRFKPRNLCAHKGRFGHVLVVGGDLGYVGAALMAAMAAARVGAGLVSIATRNAHAPSMITNRPELMCHGVDHPSQLQDLVNKSNVIVVGPGLGTSSWAKSLFDTVKAAEKPLVIDADGLNLLASENTGNRQWVLTPHPGEAARLLSSNTEKVMRDRFSAVTELHDKYQATMLLKGYGTLVYDGHRYYVNPTGNPGMASGGFGDVLSGVIAGLMAQGFSNSDATQYGAYLHGAAADRAASEGQRGMMACDLLPELRKLVNNL